MSTRMRGVLLVVFFTVIWQPSGVFGSLPCDSLRRQPCDGEVCVAKYKAIQDCETAVVAEEQARRRRQLQRQRSIKTGSKKDRD